MRNAPDDLAALRREIDSIDENLHDLLMRRGEVVAGIGRCKPLLGQPPLRPAREAALLRRLLARHTGALPPDAIFRIWREIIAASIRVQGGLTVGCCPLGECGSALRLAHENFGLDTPVTMLESAADVVEAVARDEVSAGLVPLAGASAAPGWWHDMAAAPGVHVVARLPWFGGRGAAGGKSAGAFVIAAVAPEESGEDRSLIMHMCAEAVERARVAAALAGHGLEAGADVWEGTDGRVHVADVAGFVRGGDSRVRGAARMLDADVRWLGAYAVPYAGRG